MKTQTDNSNIVVPESLEDAANKGFDSIKDLHVNNLYRTGFRHGSNWKEEQLQPLIDSHAELLEALKDLFYSANYENIEPRYKGIIPFYVGKKGIASDESIHKAKSAIERANNLIK